MTQCPLSQEESSCSRQIKSNLPSASLACPSPDLGCPALWNPFLHSLCEQEQANMHFRAHSDPHHSSLGLLPGPRALAVMETSL